MSPVPCPVCLAQLKLPQGATAGRQIRCPACQHVFSVPSASAERAGAEAPKPAIDNPADAPTHRLDGQGDHRGEVPASEIRRRVRAQIVEEESAESYAFDGGADRPPLIGKVGRFELRRFLGQGAFGKVYLAHDPQLDRAVALKVPRVPPRDQRGVRQFMKEATSAARLRHPNIVTIYEAGQAGETIYIASEYVEGMPLSVRLAERPPKPSQAVRWIRDLARGLQYAHDLGVIHRDIKPANVMIGRDDRPQLMDFGLALRRDADVELSETGIVGTPAYMSPEQARGEHSEVGPKSDQFSLAVMLFELLTGATPFRGSMPDMLKQITDPNFRPLPPHRLKPEIPSDLSAVCMKALSKRPGDRYRTVGDLAADLGRWLDGKRILAGKAQRGSGEPGALRRMARWLRKHPSRAAIAAIALLLLTGGIIGALRVRERIQDADRKLEMARRIEKERDADLLRERGARLGSQGKPAEGVVLLARSYELASELDDPERARAVMLAFGDASWELPAPPGLSGDAAINWRLAGGLVLGVPVPEVGEGELLPHAGLAKYTGYVAGGTRVVTSLDSQQQDKKESPLQLSDARTNAHFATLPSANALVFSPNARHAYYAGRLTWGVWDTERNALIGPQHEKDQHPSSVAFNHDGTRLLALGEFGLCEVWDPIEMRRINQESLHAIRDAWGRARYPVALSPDGTRIVHLLGPSALFWQTGEKLDPREFMNRIRSTRSEITAAAFSLDGANVYLATEKTTEAWTAAGVRIGDWLPASRVRQIVFSPNGRQVVLVNPEGARLWDVDSKRPIGPARHAGATRVQFRPDGRQLLTVSDRQAHFWPHPTVDPAKRGIAARLWAEATAGLEVEADGTVRPLSDAERTDRRTQFAELAGLPAN